MWNSLLCAVNLSFDPAERHQHPRREHRRQRRNKGSLPGVPPLGEEERPRAEAARPEVHPAAAVLDSGGQHLVLENEAGVPETPGAERLPRAGEVQDTRTVQQFEVLLEGLQLSSGNADESRTQV